MTNEKLSGTHPHSATAAAQPQLKTGRATRHEFTASGEISLAAAIADPSAPADTSACADDLRTSLRRPSLLSLEIGEPAPGDTAADDAPPRSNRFADFAAILGEQLGEHTAASGEREVLFRKGAHFYLLTEALGIRDDEGVWRDADEHAESVGAEAHTALLATLPPERLSRFCAFEPIALDDAAAWLREHLPADALPAELRERLASLQASPRFNPSGPRVADREWPSFCPAIHGIAFASIDTPALAIFVSTTLSDHAAFIRGTLQIGGADGWSETTAAAVYELLAISAEVFAETANGFTWKSPTTFRCLEGLGSLRELSAQAFLEHCAEVFVKLGYELADAAQLSLHSFESLPLLEALTVCEDIAAEWCGLANDHERKGLTRLQLATARTRRAMHTEAAA